MIFKKSENTKQKKTQSYNNNKKMTAWQKHTYIEYSGQYHSDLRVNSAFTYQ